MSKKVLVVDDSPTMRNLIKSTMQPEGWEIITAQDGEKALKEIRNQEVDFVITDVNMPNMDGITFIKELRSNPDTADLPILIITTEGNDKTRNAGKDAGANGWIIKPFEPAVLIAAVSKLSSG